MTTNIPDTCPRCGAPIKPTGLLIVSRPACNACLTPDELRDVAAQFQAIQNAAHVSADTRYEAIQWGFLYAREAYFRSQDLTMIGDAPDA